MYRNFHYLAILVLILFLQKTVESQSVNRESISDEQIESTLNDKRYLMRQLKCILGEASCDPVGRRLKNLAPLVLRGSCPNCTKDEIKQIQKVLTYIQGKYPEEFQRLLRKFNG